MNFLEHKEHRNYNHKEQYKNKLPGTQRTLKLKHKEQYKNKLPGT